MDVRFHPLTDWPAKATLPGKRKSRWSFRADFSTTLSELEDELRHLGARDVVIQVAADPGDIRLDGWLRANARVRHPGVVLSFESRHGPLRYLTDVYELWQHNLRAIALGLKALRAVDRYGITQRGEQYTGWKALPEHAGGQSEFDAKRVLLEHAGNPDGPLEAKSAFRLALKRTHPDHGGDRAAFEAVQEAGRRLGVA